MIGRQGRVLGVDLGSRRIGVAVSDGDQRLAAGVTTIHRNGDTDADRKALAALVTDYEAVGVVVGLPRSLSGALGPAARRALDEVEALRGVVGVAVETEDERLTTVTAASGLRAAARTTASGRRRGSGRAGLAVIDIAAATVLLQSWLDRRAVTGAASR